MQLEEKNTQREQIEFFYEATDLILLKEKEIKDWISKTSEDEQKTLGNIEIVFCSDEYLLQINKDYLQHDYYTDIITFPLGSDPIIANVFISVDRVKENAQLYKVSFENELHRVIIHGLLHLFGYGDKTSKEKEHMRSKEDHYLSLRDFD